MVEPDKATLSAWRIRLGARPLRLNARVLEPPRLSALMSNQSTNAILVPRNGAYDLRGKKFARAARLSKWGILVCRPSAANSDVYVGTFKLTLSRLRSLTLKEAESLKKGCLLTW